MTVTFCQEDQDQKMEVDEVSATKTQVRVRESESERVKEKPNWQGAVIKDKSVWFTASCGSHEAAKVR